MNPCCNATTCTLKGDAVCAHGQCCQDCQVGYTLISQPWHSFCTGLKFFHLILKHLKLNLADISSSFSWAHTCLSFICLNDCCMLSTFECSWNQQAPHAVNPVTLVTSLSSAPVQALTAPPTSTCMMATPATTWTATVITASVRLTNSSVSPCGAKVCGKTPCWLTLPMNGYVMVTSFFFMSFIMLCRSKTSSRNLLSKGKLCRRPLWQLWQGLQRLLCQMWSAVRPDVSIETYEYI